MKTTQFQRKNTVRMHRIKTRHFTAGPPNFPNCIRNTSSFLHILETSLNLHSPLVIGGWGVFQSNKKPSKLQQILSASGGSFKNSELTRRNSVRKVVLLMF